MTSRAPSHTHRTGEGYHSHVTSFSFGRLPTSSISAAPTPSAHGASTSIARTGHGAGGRRGSFGDWTDNEIMDDCLPHIHASHVVGGVESKPVTDSATFRLVHNH